MDISRCRERIKNLWLYNTDKFDPNKPEDIKLAEQMAANAVIAMADWINESNKTTEKIATKTVISTIETDLRKDAEWWNPEKAVLDEIKE